MVRNSHIFKSEISEDFDEYLKRIKNEKEWVGDIEMKALSLQYKIDFAIYFEISQEPKKIINPGSTQIINLASTGERCYDCVYSKKELAALAFCQSIVYNILYKDIFGLGADVDMAVEKMLHDKAYSKQRRNNMLCHLFKENCRIESTEDNGLADTDQSMLKEPQSEIRKALEQGIPPFPYKVAKTLDPTIYRNVEFDIWNEQGKDQRSDQFIVPKLEPGVKCRVHLNKDVYLGYVQAIHMDKTVTVYIEELCKRCVVSISAIEILPVASYKSLTWQGGKTYKVPFDGPKVTYDKYKGKKTLKKHYQDYALQTPLAYIPPPKPAPHHRSNSLSTPLSQHSPNESNNLHKSPQQANVKNVKASSNGSNSPPPHKEIQQGNYNNQLNSMPNYPHIWTTMEQVLPTSPIPIPGKMIPEHFNSASPESLNEYHDSGWEEGNHSSSAYTYPPSQMAVTHVYSTDVGYTTLSRSASFSSSSVALGTTTPPLPIPGTPMVAHQVNEEICPNSAAQTNQNPPTVALYPYPMYSGMYLVCRDGSTFPVINPWPARETSNGTEFAAAGIPSVYINTPPGGMSPPLAHWISGSVTNFNSWAPGISSTVAFTPPLEMNAYQPIVSPPWSPQPGMFVAPPAPQPIAYQMQFQQQQTQHAIPVSMHEAASK